MAYLEGVDYSFTRPDVLRLHALGKHFAVRYTSGAGKSISVDEVARIKAAGLNLVLNHESTAKWMHGGWNAGVAAAHVDAAVIKTCGLPDTALVYLSDDESDGFTPDEQACANGYASVRGKDATGVYGGMYAGPRIVSLGFKLWLADYGAPRPPFPGAALWQYKGTTPMAGGLVDLDRALTTDYGQVWKTQPEPRPKIPPFPGFLSPGMRNGDVGVFFGQLRRRYGWRFGVFSPDDGYGPFKARACKTFQAFLGAHGYRINTQPGVVGQTTWRAAWDGPK